MTQNPPSVKPLGRKSYGSIPHLPGSRMGPADHHCHEGQSDICTVKVRDKHDRVYVQEKLDGSNVGVAKVHGEILAITRAGYLAMTSPYVQHHVFARWVEQNRSRFDSLLKDGERACGEWLLEAHGTKYKLQHEPFVLFDIMRGTRRETLNAIIARNESIYGAPFETPMILAERPVSIETAMALVGELGWHGATEQVEGVMYRVERHLPAGHEVDFLAKFVRHDKEDGKYLRDQETRTWNELLACDQHLLRGL